VQADIILDLISLLSLVFNIHSINCIENFREEAGSRGECMYSTVNT